MGSVSQPCKQVPWMLADPGTQGLPGDSERVFITRSGVLRFSPHVSKLTWKPSLSHSTGFSAVCPYLISFSPKAAETGVIFIPSLWIRRPGRKRISVIFVMSNSLQTVGPGSVCSHSQLLHDGWLLGSDPDLPGRENLTKGDLKLQNRSVLWPGLRKHC